MDHSNEQRREQRLSYRWPIWFSEDLTKAVYLGLMEDVSSGGIAFTYAAQSAPLQVGRRLTVRFNIPRFDGPDPLATVGVTRAGQVRWVTPGEHGTQHIGLQFDMPLSLKPAEEAGLAAMYQPTGA